MIILKSFTIKILRLCRKRAGVSILCKDIEYLHESVHRKNEIDILYRHVDYMQFLLNIFFNWFFTSILGTAISKLVLVLANFAYKDGIYIKWIVLACIGRSLFFVLSKIRHLFFHSLFYVW